MESSRRSSAHPQAGPAGDRRGRRNNRGMGAAATRAATRSRGSCSPGRARRPIWCAGCASAIATSTPTSPAKRRSAHPHQSLTCGQVSAAPRFARQSVVPTGNTPYAEAPAWHAETPRLRPAHLVLQWLVSAISLLVATWIVPGADVRELLERVRRRSGHRAPERRAAAAGGGAAAAVHADHRLPGGAGARRPDADGGGTGLPTATCTSPRSASRWRSPWWHRRSAS